MIDRTTYNKARSPTGTAVKIFMDTEVLPEFTVQDGLYAVWPVLPTAG